jgi:hypothetical protein
MENRLVTIATLRSCGKADDVSRFHLGQNTFKANGRAMMRFVLDDHPIADHQVRDCALPDETLNHSHIEPAVRFDLARPDLSDLLRIDAKKQRELADPLVEERLTMDQNEGISLSGSDEVRTDYRLADETASSARLHVFDCRLPTYNVKFDKWTGACSYSLNALLLYWLFSVGGSSITYLLIATWQMKGES